MKPVLFALLVLTALPAFGQAEHMGEPLLGETTTKVSEHVVVLDCPVIKQEPFCINDVLVIASTILQSCNYVGA